MGTLKPGANYIYERANGVTYAREFGSTERRVIGWDYDTEQALKKVRDEILWKNILDEAESNPTLQKAVERVIMLYKLSVSKYD